MVSPAFFVQVDVRTHEVAWGFAVTGSVSFGILIRYRGTNP